MHDVSRDSLLRDEWDKKKQKYGTGTEYGRDTHHHDDEHDHSCHNDEDDHGHFHHDADHSHGAVNNHGHSHHESAHKSHDLDDHVHHHHDRSSRERVYDHLHEHRHVFYHSHHHSHHPDHHSVFHKLFKDPVRDWFALGLMILLIGAAHFQLLPEGLGRGCLIAAAVIGIFPAMKNSLFSALLRRKPNMELAVTVVLVGLLVSGHAFAAALCSLFMLAGSFMKLDFSWRS